LIKNAEDFRVAEDPNKTYGFILDFFLKEALLLLILQTLAAKQVKPALRFVFNLGSL
jgi:hypothetical protein